MSENEWFSVFFQTAFGLAIAQKYFNFVHNDLHSSNVMFKKTLLKYLYFQLYFINQNSYSLIKAKTNFIKLVFGKYNY